MTYEQLILHYARQVLSERQWKQLKDRAGDVPLFGHDGLRRYIAERSIEAFARLYFPDMYTYPMADIHQQILQDSQAVYQAQVKRSPGLRIVRAIPRGHSKSTYYSRILPLHGYLYGWSTHTVIIGATDTAAKQDKLRKIINDLETNERIKEDFTGIKGRVFGAEFIQSANGSAISAYGAGSGAIRGLSNPSRPTLVLLDDVDTLEASRNTEQSDKIVEWFNKDVLPIGTVDGTTSIVLIGTVISKHTLIYNALHSITFADALTVPAVESFADHDALWQQWEKEYLKQQPKSILEDTYYQNNKAALLQGTKVLWETPKTNYYALMQLKFNDVKAFYSEYQNNPTEAGSKLGKLSFSDMPSDLENWWLIASLDPTAKGGIKHDLSAFVEMLFNPKTKQMIVTYVDAKQRNYDETINDISARILGSTKRYDGIFIEENSIGYAIASEIEKNIRRANYTVTKINNTLPKEERIDTLSQYMNREQLTALSTVDLELFKEIDTFPSKNAKDDVLDSVSQVVMELRKRRLLDIQPVPQVHIGLI